MLALHDLWSSSAYTPAPFIQFKICSNDDELAHFTVVGPINLNGSERQFSRYRNAWPPPKAFVWPPFILIQEIDRDNNASASNQTCENKSKT